MLKESDFTNVKINKPSGKCGIDAIFEFMSRHYLTRKLVVCCVNHSTRKRGIDYEK